MRPPLVSICVPNLNKRPFLEARMESLLAQTVTDWEIIVCDSYSDDGSWEYFQRLKADARIHLHQVPRAGLYAGWNECLRRATGEYIYIATSDDTSHPAMLERMLLPLQRFPEVDISICNFSEIDEAGVPRAARPRGAAPALGDTQERRCIRKGEAEFILHACYVTVWAIMNSIVFRRRLLDRTGLFRTDQRSFADVEWTLRASLASDVAVVPEELVAWRVYGTQATPRKMWPDDVRILVAAVENVLRDPASGIPEGWHTVPGWQKKIVSVIWARYIESFDLYRWVARSNPGEFLQNVWRAFRSEPGILWQRALQGFRYGEELAIDPAAVVGELMRDLRVEWPPQRMWS